VGEDVSAMNRNERFSGGYAEKRKTAGIKKPGGHFISMLGTGTERDG